jgi:hypothetical protein
MTTYLRFTDEAQAQALMPYAFDPELQAPAGMTIDIVGIIHKPTGEMLMGEDGEYPAMAPIPGFHANVIGTIPDALLPFVVTPAAPSRIFAC